MTDVLKDLYKVNSRQIFLLWRNLASSFLIIITMALCSRLLPAYLAPIISTVACAALYVLTYSRTRGETESCLVVPYTMFLITLTYTVVTVVLNLFNVWYLLNLPDAVIFFNGYFVPALIFCPCAVIVSGVMYFRRHKLSICRDCRLHNDSSTEKGRVGIIFSQESELQIKNIFFLFLLITIVSWTYFLFEFVDVSITNRDAFVFFYVLLITLILDTVVLGMRYYNLYLDLKERDELVSPAELQNLSTRTYLRFYVICGDNILLVSHGHDELRDVEGKVYDTPFLVRQIVKSIPEDEVKSIIERSTGVKGGLLRFFFGRKVSDIGEHRILRYFYFLPGTPADYPKLAAKGEWLSSEKFKTIYNTNPFSLSTTLLNDMSRLATIIVTSKTYKENGERRNKLQNYRPSFNFEELATTKVNMQDDVWIRVSLYNSDHRFFRIKRFLRHDEKKRAKYPFRNNPLS